MLHLRVRILHILRRVRTLTIPSPLLHKLRRQLTLEHLHHVLAQHREEFVSMERATSCDEKTLGGGVGGDDEVGGGGKCVPVYVSHDTGDWRTWCCLTSKCGAWSFPRWHFQVRTRGCAPRRYPASEDRAPSTGCSRVLRVERRCIDQVGPRGCL